MIRIKRKYAIFEICSKFCFHINDFYLISKCKLILLEIESLLKEQLRSRLECQGINVDQVNLFEDLNNLNVNLDDDEQESSDDPGSDSSADDGLPLHLERFAKVSLISFQILNKPLKIYLRVLKLFQSGEILPNLVTLNVRGLRWEKPK